MKIVVFAFVAFLPFSSMALEEIKCSVVDANPAIHVEYQEPIPDVDMKPWAFFDSFQFALEPSIISGQFTTTVGDVRNIKDASVGTNDEKDATANGSYAQINETSGKWTIHLETSWYGHEHYVANIDLFKIGSAYTGSMSLNGDLDPSAYSFTNKTLYLSCQPK
jgi:hypothetical protein